MFGQVILSQSTADNLKNFGSIDIGQSADYNNGKLLLTEIVGSANLVFHKHKVKLPFEKALFLKKPTFKNNSFNDVKGLEKMHVDNNFEDNISSI
jgi:hypothetical protein